MKPTTRRIRQHPRVLEAMRAAMKAGRNNESILITNIEDFVPREVRAAYDTLIETVVEEARGDVLAPMKLAAIRLGILRDRMDGCNAQAIEEARKPTHELMDEAQMFVDEACKAAEILDRREHQNWHFYLDEVVRILARGISDVELAAIHREFNAGRSTEHAALHVLGNPERSGA